MTPTATDVDQNPTYMVWHIATDGVRRKIGDRPFKSRYAAEYAGELNVERHGGTFEVEPVADPAAPGKEDER